MQDSRLYSLDFLKFVAALMITNSHFQPLYEDVSPSLATYFHYVCHFSVMVMGGLCYLLRDKIKCSSIMRDMLWMIVSFIAYFVILKIGKGAMGIRYYSQITALIPLHIFVYYLYKVASYSWCKKAFCSMIVGKIMSWIAALTLEIYIVQFSFVTNQFNSLFPLNLLLVFAIIVLAAYLLKVMTSLFLAVLSKEDLEWKEIVRL